uniref:Uncharacterized protein n=1 Tax=uncultured Desulfobacterium sp. TaxID=201089 RepID=E1YCR8_9BACT|nr:unknown protein [uncultured Desulfobacterium sp.]
MYSFNIRNLNKTKEAPILELKYHYKLKIVMKEQIQYPSIKN